MKQFISILLICLGFCVKVPGQCQIPNGNFETVVDITDTLSAELDITLKFPVISPIGWIPLERTVEIAFSEFIVEYFDLDTLDIDVFSGLRPNSPGAQGTETALALQGDTLALASDVLQFFPCGARPDKITGYFKYVGEQIRDSLTIVALLTSDVSLSEEDAIGVATFSAYGGPGEFTKFEAQFTYKSDEIPDTAVVLIAAHKYKAVAQDTSYYAIDEIRFEGGSVPVRDIAEYQDFLLVPNPVIDVVRLDGDQHMKSSLKIYDSLGKLVFEVDQVNSEQINLSALASGMYLARLEGKQNIFIQKIVKL